jgi:hypothetical protein
MPLPRQPAKHEIVSLFLTPAQAGTNTGMLADSHDSCMTLSHRGDRPNNFDCAVQDLYVCGVAHRPPGVPSRSDPFGRIHPRFTCSVHTAASLALFTVLTARAIAALRQDLFAATCKGWIASSNGQTLWAAAEILL